MFPVAGAGVFVPDAPFGLLVVSVFPAVSAIPSVARIPRAYASPNARHSASVSACAASALLSTNTPSQMTAGHIVLRINQK